MKEELRWMGLSRSSFCVGVNNHFKSFTEA